MLLYLEHQALLVDQFLDLFEQWEDMDFARIRNETELFELQTCPKPLHDFER